MNVLFFRHGPAVPHGTPGVPESDRPLTDEGRRKTERAVRGLETLDLGIDAVVTSPLVRARETAEILSEVLGLGAPKESEKLLPDVPPLQFLSVLDGLKAESPVLVGHEPSLSAAVAFLIGAPPEEALELKKAGLAVVRLRTSPGRPQGTLRLLLAPATLRALSR